MKIILLVSLCLFSLSAAAAEECYSYLIKGVVRATSNSMSLIVHEGTMSQKALPISFHDVHKLASYIDVTIEGDYIIKSDKIEDIVRVERSLPDPLNHVTHSFMKKKGTIKCP